MNFLRSLVRNLPMAPFRNWHPAAQDWLDQHAPDFDLIMTDHLIPMVYYRKTMPPAILVEQNAEFSLWERAAAVHARWYLRPLLAFEAARMRAFEQRACRAARTVVTLTPEDAALLSPLAASTPVEVIPPCILSAPLQGFTPPSPPSGKRFLFVGTLSWEPNSDGLLWFTREIWPQVLLRHPDATLDVVGRGLPAAAHAKLTQVPGLQLHGFQEHLAPFYAKARVIVAPLRFGSGFKLKVLEAMAFGIPVLTTPVGAEGFATGTGFPLQVCSDTSQWHTQIDSLLSDDAEWSHQSGIQLAGVRDHYSLASRSLKFEALFHRVGTMSRS